MKEIKELIIPAIIAFLLVIISYALLQYSGFEVLQLASFENLGPILNEISSPYFIGFLICISAFFATASLICIKRNKAFAYKAIMPSTIIASAIAALVFGTSNEKLFVGIFFIISTIVLIETAFLKKEEFKTFITFRTAGSATQKAITIISIGIFISTAFIISSNQEKYVKEFEQSIMALALKESNNGQLYETFADAMVQNQKQTLQLVTSSPQFQALKTKQDLEVQAFVLAMDSIQNQFESPELKQKTINQFENNSKEAKKAISFETIKKQIPFIQLLEEFYWLLIAIAAAALFMLLGNIIIVNLSSAFAWLADKAMPKKATS